jgi:hypothetical protein
VSVAGPWTSTSCVALAASGVRWRIEQAEAFREQVEHFSDAERVILADAYQALLRYGPVPDPSSPLVVHRFRDPRAGDAYVLVLPMVVVGYQVLGDTIVVQAADIIRSQCCSTAQPDTSSPAHRPNVGSPRPAAGGV